MKNYKKIFLVITVAVLTAISASVFAVSPYAIPADILSDLTGRSADNLIEEKEEEGKSFCTIALEADKLEEFKSKMLGIKKENLAKQVSEGKITQEEANDIISRLEENQGNCDGTGNRFNLAMGFRYNGSRLGKGMKNNQNKGTGKCIGKGNVR